VPIRPKRVLARPALGLFLLVFLAHASFWGALGWNQAARVGAILGFVEPGPNRFTLRIDRFVNADPRGLRTGDWATGADGHYYSNKAPGVSMIGVPAYAALYAAESALGAHPAASIALTRINVVLLNLWCSVLFTAAASSVLFAFLSAHGFSGPDALLSAIAYAFATLVFPYDTSIWGHTAAASCLLGSLCLALWPGAKGATLAGVLGGLAMLVEYTAVVGLAAVGAALLGRGVPWRRRLEFGAGAALPLLALLLYQKVAFGGFLTTAASQSNPIFLDPDRTLGLFGRFDWHALWLQTFSIERGLFAFCPGLLFAGLGARQHWRGGRKTLVLVALGAFAATLLLISTFSGQGGMASGARYLIVAIPFCVILLPESSRLGARTRWLYWGALGLSAANMLVLAAAEVMIDDPNPLYGVAYGRVLEGAYPTLPDAGNVGLNLLRLAPRWELLLFLLIFGVWSGWLLRRARPR